MSMIPNMMEHVKVVLQKTCRKMMNPLHPTRSLLLLGLWYGYNMHIMSWSVSTLLQCHVLSMISNVSKYFHLCNWAWQRLSQLKWLVLERNQKIVLILMFMHLPSLLAYWESQLNFCEVNWSGWTSACYLLWSFIISDREATLNGNKLLWF